MKSIEKKYIDELQSIIDELQKSDSLTKYLENEEEEDYLSLRGEFEPKIQELYNEIARANPLQLLDFETHLLNEDLEGMFITKILGYNVLRGSFTEEYKYHEPQNLFKSILITICNSSNFEFLKKKIGQGIQLGFALSSDIWVTDLISKITNKKVRYYLESQKLPKYIVVAERKRGWLRYMKQFSTENFYTVDFPTNFLELKVRFPALKNFLKKRILSGEDNTSFYPEIFNILKQEEYQKTEEYLEILMLFSGFFDRSKSDENVLKGIITKLRKENGGEFSNRFFDYQKTIINKSGLNPDAEVDIRFAALFDSKIDDGIAPYYDILLLINKEGFETEQVIESIREFYNSNSGMSLVNKCLRLFIHYKFAKEFKGLEVENYARMMELGKVVPVYGEIFGNELFIQGLKNLFMRYSKKVLIFNRDDKRGRDYQDVKKYIKANFEEFGFLKKKEIVELFKTKRKKVVRKA